MRTHVTPPSRRIALSVPPRFCCCVERIPEGNIRALHVCGNEPFFYFEHADNPHKDVMVWLGALWIAHGWQATNLSLEQIDRVGSVAQLRSVHTGEVLYEPSQPDVPSSLRCKATSRLAGPARTIRFLRSEKQTSSPARCPSIPANAGSSRRASLAIAAARRNDHCLGSEERTANQPGGYRA